jgi:P4 family phage/plasmid primase-like protien
MSSSIPPEYQVQHQNLTNALTLAQDVLRLVQKDLEMDPNNKRLQQSATSAFRKAGEAANKLNDLNFKIDHERKVTAQKVEKEERENQEIVLALEKYFGTDGGFENLINKYGQPIHCSERGFTLNDVFWGAALLHGRTILYSPAYDDFYQYNSKNGLWFPVTAAKLTSQLHLFLVDLDKEVFKKSPIGRCSTESFRNNAIASQCGLLEDKEAFIEAKPRHAQVANGVVEFTNDTISLKPFSPEYKSLHASPLSYEAKADCPEFIKLMAHLEECDRFAIQRAAGQMLIGRNLTQKIFIFEGEPNSGKSTIAEIILEVIGHRAVTELRTDHLKRQFELYDVHSKSLLIGSDVAHDFLMQDGAEYLKKLVGGDYIKAEKKHSNEAFMFKGNLNILIISNCQLVLRLFSDAGAWKRRLIILKFPSSNRAPEQNVPEYAQKLIEKEGPGILNWMLQGAQQLLKDISEAKGFVLTDEQKKRVEDRINESDSLSLFLKERISRAILPDSGIGTSDILSAYSTFCHDHGWGQPSSKFIVNRLSELMPHLYGATSSNKIRNAQGDYMRGYVGICWSGLQKLAAQSDAAQRVITAGRKRIGAANEYRN